MGKQSSRMVYDGKDHKDIYFRGKYHDAMYVGYELLWHKIRQEGYYLCIVENGKEGRYEEGLYIIVFDEKTQEFEMILELIYRPDSLTENYFGGTRTVDGERIYICGLSWDDVVWASIDGINYEKTNLVIKDNADYRAFLSTLYHSYSSKNDSGIITKKNYTWYVTGEAGGHCYICKITITKSEDNKYDVTQERLDTGLMYSNPFPNEKRSFNMIAPNHGDSRFALHTDYYTYKNDIVTKPDSIKNEYTKAKISYYDTEKESAGKIAEFEYQSFKYNGNNPIRRTIGVNDFYCANGVYVFFIIDYYEEFKIEKKQKLYVCFSFDGSVYSKTLIYDKHITQSDTASAFPSISSVIYRNGMYYLYGGGEKNEYYEPPYTLYLTTDFSYFQKKYIPREIKIGGRKFNTLALIKEESKTSTHDRIYFCNGEIREPEDGLLILHEDLLIYIDNMFFRESGGNRIFSYKGA